MNRTRTTVMALTVAFALAASSQTHAAGVFQEQSGIVVMEVESARAGRPRPGAEAYVTSAARPLRNRSAGSTKQRID